MHIHKPVAHANEEHKYRDADAIVTPANQGAQSPAASVADNTAAKAAAGTTDAASHPKAAKHSAKSKETSQSTHVQKKPHGGRGCAASAAAAPHRMATCTDL